MVEVVSLLENTGFPMLVFRKERKSEEEQFPSFTDLLE